MPLRNKTINQFKKRLIEVKRKERKQKEVQNKFKKLNNKNNILPQSNRKGQNQNTEPENIRDQEGRMVLFEDEQTGLNLQDPNQLINTPLVTTVYDEPAIDEVVDNNVSELMPEILEPIPPKTIPERIIEFFSEYAELRDFIPIDDKNDRSHRYLSRESKKYLPIERDMVKYNGNLVDEPGEVILKGPNTIEIKDGLLLYKMVGGTIQVHAVEEREDPVLTLVSLFDVIEKEIIDFNLQNPDSGISDIDSFMSRVKTRLDAKYKRIVKKSDIEGIMEEVTEELTTLAEETGGADAQPPSGDDNV